MADEYLKTLDQKQRGLKFKNLQMLLLDLHKGRKKRLHCGAALRMVAIDPLGNIYPCHRFVGIEEYKLGNVLDFGLDQQARGDFLSLCAEIYKKRCQTCWVRHYCVGGCYHDLLKMPGIPVIRSREECDFIKRQYEIAMGVYTVLSKKYPHILKHFDKLVKDADHND